MATSQDYMAQIQGMGDMPDYKNVIADAYNKPVLKPIVNEAQNLEAQYLPTIFDTFVNHGTGAGDMSPAAKMQMIGRNLGTLGSRITANRDIQNYYQMSINDLAAREQQNWMMRLQNLKDLQQMQFQQEQAARGSGGGGGIDFGALADLFNTGQGGGNVTGNIGKPGNLAELNAKRALSGRPALSEAYYNNTYLPQNKMPSGPGGYLKTALGLGNGLDPQTSKFKGAAGIMGGAFYGK